MQINVDWAYLMDGEVAGLPPRVRNTLCRLGLFTTQQIAAMDDRALLARRGIGPKGIAAIRREIPFLTVQERYQRREASLPMRSPLDTRLYDPAVRR